MENTPPENAPQVVQTSTPVQSGSTPIQSGSTPPGNPDSIGVKTHRFPKVLKILLIIFLIILVVLISGGIYLYKIAQQNPVIKNMANVQNLEQVIKDTKNAKSYPGTVIKHDTSQSPLQPAISNTTSDQSAQWSTYENKGYKFSIDFPADLQKKETAPGFGVSTIEFKSPSDSPDESIFQILIMPKSIAKMIGQDFDAFYALADNSSQIIKGSNNMSVNFTKISNRTVSGLRAIDFKSTTNPPDSTLEPEVGSYIEADTNLLIISGGESDKAMIESMLATFKYPI